MPVCNNRGPGGYPPSGPPGRGDGYNPPPPPGGNNQPPRGGGTPGVVKLVLALLIIGLLMVLSNDTFHFW